MPTFVDWLRSVRSWKLNRKARRKRSLLSFVRLEDRLNPSLSMPDALPVHEVAFLDARVQDSDLLQAGIRPGTAVYQLSALGDGVDQIAEVLGTYHNLDAVHVISHGKIGALTLGSAVISRATLDHYQSQLQQWGQALSGTGDLLLYGCNFAAGQAGADLLGRLSSVTGADVAASVNVTGATNLGGDWTLEAASGPIEAKHAITLPTQQSYPHLLAGEFTDLGNLGIQHARYSAVAWGDYDNDGDLDLLISGAGGPVGQSPLSIIYRNNGNNTFTDIGAGLPALDKGSAAWGDYDNDGYIDFLLSGRIGFLNNFVSQVYHNNGNGTFTNIAANLTGVFGSSVAWGDYDNDGRLDILLTGLEPNGNSIATVYRNSGNGNFTDIAANLTGVRFGSGEWGDYDQDGDLDILLSGRQGATNSTIAKVYRNNGNGNFTDIAASLTGADYGSTKWGDYDNDGDLDFLITGANDTGKPVAKIYRNNGNDSFTDLSLTFGGGRYRNAAWGDYDNDGDLDIYTTWNNTSGAAVFQNLGNDTFTDIGIALNEGAESPGIFGDYDNDGDLDILLASALGFPPSAILYRNNASTPNTVPTAPSGLSVSTLSPTSVRLTWNAASDTQTAANGLSYNLRVGTTPGGNEVLAPMARANGLRSIAQRGMVETTTWTLTGLDPTKTYYWSVQAVDTAFAGSAFAGEKSFATGPFTNLGSLGMAGVADGSMAWGDYDNDGDLDVLLTGFNSSEIAKVYRNNGNGSFTDINANLTGVNNSSVAWGDYDNDGDLDILLTGLTNAAVSISKVYRNDGNGTFADINANLTGVFFSSVGWGDFDNDGDLDVLLTGRVGGLTRMSKVYRNDGNGSFTDINANLTGVEDGSAAWVDYDNDGDLDIFLTGIDGIVRVSKVYRNEGNGSFTDINASLRAVYRSSVAWGDYDNDGDLDILLTGSSSSGWVTKLYRNDGGGSFADISANLTAVDDSSVAWGDYDNDGDLDILLTGKTSTLLRISKVYRNDASGIFTDISANLTGVGLSSVAWGDYDNDSDLDLFVAGQDGFPITLANIYRNNAATPNTAPSAPTGLNANVLSPTSVSLTWNAASDTQTAANGLSYNLRVGTTPGGNEVLAPMARANGLRSIAQRGMVETTTWTLTGLDPTKTYYWSVQAVDTAFAGSAFATEATFQTFRTITGKAFLDLNGNGTLDTGEGGISGLTIYVDFNNDGFFNGNEPSSVTDANGTYFLQGNYPSGNLVLREVLPSGQALTGNAAAGFLTVSTNSAILNIGNRKNSATLPLPTAPPLFQPGSANANTSFIQNLYRSFIGREAETGGLNHWLNELRKGVSRSAVVEGFIRSTEYCTNLVKSYYRTFLKREAESGGLNAWVTQLQKGMSAETLAEKMLTSPEATALYSTNANFVKVLYQSFLARDPSATEVTLWSDIITSTSRSQVVLLVLRSSESAGRLVDSLYNHYLQRAPEAAGRTALISGFQTGSPLMLGIVNLVASSQEFFNKCAIVV